MEREADVNGIPRPRSATMAAALTLLLALTACREGDPLAEGRRRIEAHAWREAVPLLARAVEQGTALPADIAALCRARLDLRDIDGALRDARRLRDVPDWSDRALALEADILVAGGRFDGALELIGGAARERPESAVIAETAGSVNRVAAEVRRGLALDLLEDTVSSEAARSERAAILRATTSRDSDWPAARDGWLDSVASRWSFEHRAEIAPLLESAHAAITAAFGHFDRAIRLAPERSRPRLERARLAFARGDADAAASDLEALLATRPPSGESAGDHAADLEQGALLLAEIHERAGRFDAAATTLRDIRPRARNPLEADMRLCQILDATGQLATMEPVLDALLEAQTYEAGRPPYFKARILLARGQARDAHELFVRAYTLNRGNHLFAAGVAACLEALGDLDKAAVYHDIARDLAPWRSQIHVDRALCMHRLGWTETATRDLLDALSTRFTNRNSQDYKRIRDTLIGLYRAQGTGISSLEEARVEYQRNRSNIPVALSYARFLLAENRLLEAEDVLRDPRRRFPDMTEVQVLTGLLALRQKRWTEAVRILEAAGKEEPGNAEIPAFLGEAALGLNDLASARRHFERVLAVDAAHAPSRKALLEIAVRERRDDAVIDAGRQLLSDWPDDVDVFAAVAGALRRTGRLGEAAALLGRRPVIPESRTDDHVRLARALLELNRPTEAEEVLVAVALRDPRRTERLVELGRILLRAGRPEGAWRVGEAGLAGGAGAGLRDLRLLLADSAAARGRHDLLSEQLVELRLLGDRVLVHERVIESCLELGRIDEALSNVEAARRDGVASPRLAALTARTLLARHDAEGALRAVADAERTAESVPADIARVRAEAQFLLGRKEAALAWFEPAIGTADRTERPRLLAALLEGLRAAGDIAGAASRAEAAATAHGGDLPLRLLAVEILAEAGEFRAAERLALPLAARNDAPAAAGLAAVILALVNGDARKALAAARTETKRRPLDGDIATAAFLLRIVGGEAAAVLAEAGARPRLHPEHRDFILFLAATASGDRRLIAETLDQRPCVPRCLAGEWAGAAGEWAGFGLREGGAIERLARHQLLRLWPPTRKRAPAELERILEMHAGSGRVLSFMAARDMIHAGRGRDALRVLRPLVAQDTDDEPALLLTAEANLSLREAVDLGAFLKAALTRPNVTRGFVLDLAELLAREEQWGTAITILGHVRESSPDAEILAARIFLGAGRMKDAWRQVSRHRNRLRDEPFAAEVELSELAGTPGDAPRAATLAREAIERFGTSETGLMQAALRALVAVGAEAEAEAAARAFLAARPFDARALEAVRSAFTEATTGIRFRDAVAALLSLADPAHTARARGTTAGS